MRDAAAPQPILVIGMNRSGTKWLSNLLCNHPEIYGVQSARHGGVIETNMFGAMSSVVGDIRKLENFVALVEIWTQTDFVRTTGVEKDFLYGLAPRPASCAQMFRRLMDEAARRAGARYWLQKTGPLEARAALREIGDARVIVIERDVLDTLESRIQLRRNRGTPFSVARGASESAYQRKLLAGIRRRHPVLDVAYETLRRDTAGELQRICSALGLAFEPVLLEVGFRPNTSYERPGGERRERPVLTPRERQAVRAATAVGRLVPLTVFEAVRALARDRSPHLVPGTFAEIAAERGLDVPRNPPRER